jgi:two-component system response regulator PilR (NtrC family)
LRPNIRPNDLRALSEHFFPGNVRELRNILERSLLKTDEHEKWLGLDRTWQSHESLQTPSAPSESVQAPQPAALPPERQLSPIEAQEYQLIRQTLRETKGGIRRAAAKLGLSPQALLRRLEKWPELRETSG